MMETLFCNLLSKFKQLKGGSVPDAGAGGSLAGRPLATSRFDATSRVIRVFCGILTSELQAPFSFNNKHYKEWNVPVTQTILP